MMVMVMGATISVVFISGRRPRKHEELKSQERLLVDGGGVGGDGGGVVRAISAATNCHLGGASGSKRAMIQISNRCFGCSGACAV